MSVQSDDAPKALVLLANGAEEMEVAICVDVLRRGGIEVTVAGVDGNEPVTCSRGMVLTPDCGLGDAMAEVTDPDAVVLPGGGDGAKRLGESIQVGELLRRQDSAGRWIAAICAAPQALVDHNIGAGRKMTSHPSVKQSVAAHGEYVEEPVVESRADDHCLLTSRGPGTAFEFALALVGRLRSDAVATELRAPMMLA